MTRPHTTLPLLETKLQPPRRRSGTLQRSRLHRRLASGSLPEIVLVSAGAGFGKTTLLTEWLAADDAAAARTAWLSLDRRDTDPAVFWTYVIAAIRKIEPDIGDDAVGALQAAPAALDAVITNLVNDLAQLDTHVVLVLDDYHLIESMAVHESLVFLLEHLPAQLHLIVTSRADPPWPLAALRASGALLELRSSDLRFTADEISAYLNDAMGLSLPAPDLDALEGRTEGWIAALQLAALSLQGRPDPGTFIASFAGDDRFIVDYLVDEVLDRQPDDVRSFLLATSILHRLTAPLCDAVTGRTDSRTVLDALDRSNLFLIALDDNRRWYRYHHLFGDVLRARLTDERPEAIAGLHGRASAWFEAAGDRSEAIRHAMAAQDFDRAAELIELSIPDLRQARQEATLRQWLEALPADVFPDRPVLTVGLVGSRMAIGDPSGVDALLDQAEVWLDPDRPKTGMVVHDHVELARLPAQTAMYRAGLALLRGDLTRAVFHGRRAAATSADDDHLGRGAAAALIGLAQWADGNLADAADQYAAAIAEFVEAGHYADVLGCSLVLADMQAAQGHLGAAERTVRAGIDLAERHGPLRGTADVHIGLAELHLERNELRAAADHLRQSLGLGEHLALPQHAYRWRVVDARLRAADGEHAAALELLAEAERRYNTDFSPPVRPVSALTARIQIACGDTSSASEWAARAGVTRTDPLSYVREYEHFTLARLLIATHRPADAITLLERLLAAATAGGRAGSVIEAHLLLALAHDASGDRTAASSELAEALGRAETERYVRVFLDEGDQMVRLLDAARLEPTPTWAPAPVDDAAPPPTTKPMPLIDRLSPRELDVLRLLRTDLTGPEIAAELIVSLNTVRTHTKSIFTKLGVTNRRAAVRRAEQLRLL